MVTPPGDPYELTIVRLYAPREHAPADDEKRAKASLRTRSDRCNRSIDTLAVLLSAQTPNAASGAPLSFDATAYAQGAELVAGASAAGLTSGFAYSGTPGLIYARTFTFSKEL